MFCTSVRRSGISALLMGIATVVVIGMASTPALAQSKRGTSVGQVNGTPAGSPGQRVRVDAGLSEAPISATGYWWALRGPVKMYYASGSTWRYYGTVTATGNYGGVYNTYAIASFYPTIARTAPRGRYIRLKFVYDGDGWHYSSVGYGEMYVQ